MGMQFTVFSFTPNTVLCMPSHLLLRICPELKIVGQPNAAYNWQAP